MEMEPTTPVVAKKLWSILRAVLFVLRKGFSKGKIVFDLHVLLKHGKVAGKAFRNLMLHHYSAVSCRSDDALSFVAPREYEFSCSNSPAYPAAMLFHKRNHRHRHGRLRKSDVSTLAAVQRVLDMLNNEAAAAAAAGEPPSPVVHVPGFGKSPMVRQLRITDSPFPVNYDGDSQVDTAAEEFIKNFYKDLRSQKGTALESPYRRGLLSYH